MNLRIRAQHSPQAFQAQRRGASKDVHTLPLAVLWRRLNVLDSEADRLSTPGKQKPLAREIEITRLHFRSQNGLKRRVQRYSSA
jgi:hypothetical protein